MERSTIIRLSVYTFFTFCSFLATAQSILPPVAYWEGKSESLIAKSSNAWITPAEKSGFKTTPGYEETMGWFKKLATASPLVNMVSIGKSPEGRDIFMLIVSTEKMTNASALKKSGKPLLLVQAGIHAGEIDGKDAGMMLLRDIAFGNKRNLINAVNLLFIPILNVDGHERSSPFNRPNQRGPENMGWRTNAQNLNLNRDYTKLDTREIRAVIKVINEYDPLLYMDIHVTDGADYQYDITFGGNGMQGYSPAISNWLMSTYKPVADKDLQANGHIPGPLLFAANDRDFSAGNMSSLGEPRFSDAYGNLRHLASVLVENHSLKPFRQRVLGTYVLLESTLKLLVNEGKSLQRSTAADKAGRPAKIPMLWKVPQLSQAASFETQSGVAASEHAVPPDSMLLLGITSTLQRSAITNADYVTWTGQPTSMKIASYKASEPIGFINRPTAYWIPAAKYEVIERMKLHGVKMEIITQPRELTVEMYRIQDASFQNASGKALPFESHVQVTGTTHTETSKQVFAAGSARIITDQPLGDLAMLLLEPSSMDSYFQWGFFNEIFQRTEYIEAYVMEPTITKMLGADAALATAFEQKKAQDPAFAKDPYAIYEWFYSKTNYYDHRYLLYPVAREL